MAGHITVDQVRHVAKLARLRLSEAQVEQYTAQLGNVLDYIEKIDRLDIDAIEPMNHPHDLVSVTRNDEPTDALTQEQALSNAPARSGPFFKVPKVMGDGSSA